MDNILLQMKNVNKQFPGVYVLKDVNFELEKGEVHALLGENGAGKSTLMKVLGGIYSIDKGEIYIDGQRVEVKSVKDAQDLGISIIHQELVLVPYMTVAENIYLGRELVGASGLVDKKAMIREAQKLLDSFELKIKASSLVVGLTVAQQQMVEIIKAISFNAKILVMDEPTSSLTDKEVEFLFSTIVSLKRKGVGIVYISHRMSELSQISDRITVMRDGEYIGTKVTKSTTKDELISMMVGRELTNYYTRTYNEPGETILEVKNLTREGILKDVSFKIKKGEILGMAGLMGAGRSEVMRAIFGLDPIDSGEIFIEGKKVDIKDPNDAMRYGIALVPENRKEEGLFLIQSVKFNATLKVLDKFMKFIKVDKKVENDIVNKYVKEMSIKTPSTEQLVGNLSGGNQQKVVIARWLATNPKVLILDEPTRGVDVAAKAEIYLIMNELVNSGVSIIMISSELPEIINMSDRVLVMCNGSISGNLVRGELTQEKIMHYATGGM
ncbi:sugar ABC transporter ATP-binding protein [Clostridium magnum]|uniref:Ribose import ATP-binding protein RbsA n=1 Tax=Clostridium magnum DSM 2767 TaxID=1121326 RepID=A0A161X8N8_9CLOT|nr:ribose import ATP-binding protein RbsA [Clostridium magnum DSM 2767]SHI05042.1 ribose transport system ATP-binding protein [Clostridium magnum DSM 2767]